MDKKERFNEAYKYLYDNGIIHEQKDLAAKMKASKSNISSARAGVESVLTNNFIRRFCETFKGTFNEEWLLTGEGEMLIKKEQPVVSDSEVVKSLATIFTNAMENQRRDFLKELGKYDERISELNKTIVALNEKIDALQKNIENAKLQESRTIMYSVGSNDVNPAAMNDKLKEYK